MSTVITPLALRRWIRGQNKIDSSRKDNKERKLGIMPFFLRENNHISGGQGSFLYIPDQIFYALDYGRTIHRFVIGLKCLVAELNGKNIQLKEINVRNNLGSDALKCSKLQSFLIFEFSSVLKYPEIPPS